MGFTDKWKIDIDELTTHKAEGGSQPRANTRAARAAQRIEHVIHAVSRKCAKIQAQKKALLEKLEQLKVKGAARGLGDVEDGTRCRVQSGASVGNLDIHGPRDGQSSVRLARRYEAAEPES